MKIFIRIFIVFIFMLSLLIGQRAEARYAAIVIDADSGDVLHSINANTRNYPASLTKMMTLYLLFEALDQGHVELNQQMTVSRNATQARPSKLGLRRGERITIQDAIEALIAKSANDIAVVVAEELSGSVQAFAKAMTKRARKLGMRHTTFRNPHGLPNRGHLSSARDMAVLSRFLIKDFPHYYNYFATKKFKFRGRDYKNHNKLLEFYTGADGIKTGYTKAAGYNLAASAERNGNRIIAVVFGGKTAKFRDLHVRKLLDKGFAKLSIEEGSRNDYPAKDNAAKTYFAEKQEYNKNTLLKSKTSLPPFKNSWPEEFVKKFDPVQTSTPNLENRTTDVAKLITPVVRASIGKPRTWMIQIGAYVQIAAAVRQAIYAAEKLSALGKDYEVTIMTGKSNARSVYRARLSGLNKKGAIEACSQLKKHKFDCFPMSPQM